MSNNGGLTITAVAARTGVSVAALRAWEERYGFPRPDRGSGGHRRYSDEEVARIARVVDERAAGRSLGAAIASVLEGESLDPVIDTTISAALRRRRPDLPAHTLSRRAMLAISKAIEYETAARGDRPNLYAAFQRSEVYRRARSQRWGELSRHAASTTVFADFRRSRIAAQGVREVAIPLGAAEEGEWAVVCEGRLSAAVLAGWERPDRCFEAVWSVEPSVVRTAADVARSLAERYAPGLPGSPPIHPSTADDALKRGMAITARIVAALDN